MTIEPSVIIVEDDRQLRDLTVRGLREEGFAAQGVDTARALLERLSDPSPDVVVLDIGLPDADGRDLCQALRARGVDAPILFLTARDALPDRLAGFSAGGDDYLTKPYALAELVARIHALIRRSGGVSGVRAGGLHVDPVTHSATCGAATVALSPTEFRLLAALAARPDEAVRRQALARAGWPHGAIVRDNTLDSYAARLRRKLDLLPGAPSLQTVHHVGYRLA